METMEKKKFVGAARVHPSIGGDDQLFDVEIMATDIEAAKAEMVRIIKTKRNAILDDYTIEEAKTPKLSDKVCPSCKKFIPEIDERGAKFNPIHFKGIDYCSWSCLTKDKGKV